MFLPKLNNINTSRDIVDVFKGYNHNLRISNSEFYDMKNLTSTHYPVLSPRGKRGTYQYPEGSGDNHTPNGLISKDALCYVDGTKLFINNKEVDGLVLADSPKQLISMGAYIIIMPDKKYVNTKDFTDMGNIEASFPATQGETLTVSYEMCKIDGNLYTDTVKQSSAPENPTNMQLWIDTSSTPHILKQYSETSKVWNQIATTYVRISAPNIASSFKQYDAVKISGLPIDDVPQLKDLEGKVSVLWDAHHDEENPSNDYIVVIGFIDEVVTKETQLCLERRMPIMDFIIESGNRLWGCRYGENANGDVVNEIYASKLGDFKNWDCFMQISTDSWVASCGTDGQFTGAITHLGYPLFFKENYVHKVYGNYPANYQIQTTACRGVQKGCEKSLAIVNEVLYYKARSGICAYDGSLPMEISSALGEISYSDAVACGHHNKYYISMKSSENGKFVLFVYDTSKGMWHKEDEIKVEDFCSCDGELYAIADGKIKTLLGSGKKETEDVKWMAESGIIGTSMPDKKYISNIITRMSLAIGTRINLYIQYDSCGQWEFLSSMTSTSLRSFSIPIRPKRCDHFRIRIEGEGEAKILSITKTIERGSDR
jgi:hypothetical protein